MRLRGLVLIYVVGLVLAWGLVRERVQAQAAATSGRVQVQLPTCAAAPFAPSEGRALLDALQLELAAEGVRQVSAIAGTHATESSAAQLKLESDCVPTRAQFTLHARATAVATESTRTLDLSDVPAALRARALSLALAELLRANAHATVAASASDASAASTVSTAAGSTPVLASTAAPSTSDTRGPDEHEQASVAAQSADHAAASSNKPPTPPPTAATAKPVPVPAPSTHAATKPVAREPTVLSEAHDAHDTLPPSRQAIWLGPEARWLFSHSKVLYGGTAGWLWGGLGIGAVVLFGQASDVLGSAHFGLIHARLSDQLLKLELGQQLFFAGPLLGLGATWANATAKSAAKANSSSLLTYELGLQLGVTRALSTGLDGTLCLEGGYARGPQLRADDRELATLSGIFAGVVLRVAFVIAR